MLHHPIHDSADRAGLIRPMCPCERQAYPFRSHRTVADLDAQGRAVVSAKPVCVVAQPIKINPNNLHKGGK